MWFFKCLILQRIVNLFLYVFIWERRNHDSEFIVLVCISKVTINLDRNILCSYTADRQKQTIGFVFYHIEGLSDPTCNKTLDHNAETGEDYYVTPVANKEVLCIYTYVYTQVINYNPRWLS